MYRDNSISESSQDPLKGFENQLSIIEIQSTMDLMVVSKMLAPLDWFVSSLDLFHAVRTVALMTSN